MTRPMRQHGPSLLTGGTVMHSPSNSPISAEIITQIVVVLNVGDISLTKLSLFVCFVAILVIVRARR